MQPRRMLVTDAAELPPRQSSVWLISTLGRKFMKAKIPILLHILPALAFTAGCAINRFTPNTSLYAADLFASLPYISTRFDGYSLCWQQGTYPFYFSPEYRVRGDVLYFTVRTTTSTGDAKGRYHEFPIRDKDAITALEKGGAVFWMSDGSKVQLSIIDDEP